MACRMPVHVPAAGDMDFQRAIATEALRPSDRGSTACSRFRRRYLASRLAMLAGELRVAGMQRVARDVRQISRSTAARRLGDGHDHADDGRGGSGCVRCPGWWTEFTGTC